MWLLTLFTFRNTLECHLPLLLSPPFCQKSEFEFSVEKTEWGRRIEKHWCWLKTSSMGEEFWKMIRSERITAEMLTASENHSIVTLISCCPKWCHYSLNIRWKKTVTLRANWSGHCSSFTKRSGLQIFYVLIWGDRPKEKCPIFDISDNCQFFGRMVIFSLYQFFLSPNQTQIILNIF